ncbi:hypothetical protein [Nocardioides okcheonensis]|uniref:hypothetical protein n=1 Tax=Nocardioides okcheonensis TaxID=2894081 RepID=UPI001E60A865|nr:hypothetical protein [Nocardioides okcheonensis]UFN43301.1 hypothetical protein LN652_14775 [Nocardioides okcheonensis]
MKHRAQVEVLDLGLKWDAGAPLPMLVAGARSAIVLCYESLATGEGEHVIEIRFEGCSNIRMGHPNDEVLHGHPFWGRGLSFYEAHVVHDSPWLEEHRRINSVHDYHSDATWDRLNHYFLAFHDEVVEALARDISARRVSGDMAAESARVAAEVAAGR